MSLELNPGELNPRDPEDPASLRRGNFTYFPVIPGRLEFAIEVRRAILHERPPIVAVELPGSLEDVYLSLTRAEQ